MASRTTPQLHDPERLKLSQWIGLIVAIVVFAIPLAAQYSGMPFPGLSEPGHRIFAVFLLAIVLWVSEAIPLHATATVIILAEILFISDKSLLALPEGYDPTPYKAFFAALANPILMLFLGGFFLADGAAKYDLDRNLAGVLLKPFGRSPRRIMLGLMLITAVFSMFMSNTATTATMMMVVLPVIQKLPSGDRMRVGLALCIPVAANVGGIGTPIGTPPNAIALGALAKAGYTVGFLDWMIMAVPFVLVILGVAWILLFTLFPSREKAIELSIESRFVRTWSAKVFYVTAAATIVLWLTEKLHGMTSSVVGFVPVVVLLSTRVFTTKDLQSIQWHVLWLVAGGIALGVGVGSSGLDEWLIGLVSWESLPSAILLAVLSLVALVFSTFISNSATANLLVPIGISLALSPAIDLSPVLAGVFIALGASLAMALPVSTPPNAIAVSTGIVQTKHMALVGILVGGAGWVLFVLVAPWLWALLGVLPT
ncbi:MAG: DASS family sodium-coupled anion symporter [bacterium]|nr:DASS family sodium-coupled anion symporter [bacterium]